MEIALTILLLSLKATPQVHLTQRSQSPPFFKKCQKKEPI